MSSKFFKLTLIILLIVTTHSVFAQDGDCLDPESGICSLLEPIERSGSGDYHERVVLLHGLYLIEYASNVDGAFELALRYEDSAVFVSNEGSDISGRVYREVPVDGTYQLNLNVEDGAEWIVNIIQVDPLVANRLPLRETHRQLNGDGIGPVFLEGGSYTLYYRLSNESAGTTAIKIEMVRLYGMEYIAPQQFEHDGDWAQRLTYELHGGIYYLNIQVSNVDEWEIYFSENVEDNRRIAFTPQSLGG